MYWAKTLVLCFLDIESVLITSIWWFLCLSSKVDLAQLGAIFNTIVEVFLFLDKNGDGKLNKKDMVRTLNETYPWERSPANVTKIRFSIIYITFVLILLTFSMCCFSFFYSLPSCFITFPEFLLLFWSFLQKKWTGTEMGRSLSGSSSLVS